MPLPIRTIAHRQHFTPADLKREQPGQIVACDFYIEGAERGREVLGGYEIDGIVNIDHHAPGERMRRMVSSTNLAIDHVEQTGPAESGALILVSHTDCDSVLSAAIMAGELPPEPRFGQAAISADHTGDMNEMADVLQSLEHRRDLYFSLRNLRKLLDGQPIDRTAQPAYAARLKKREAAAAAVSNRKVALDGKLAFGVLESRIDGELFPAQLPRAAVILLMCRRPQGDLWDARMRLGLTAPAGASLHQLGTERFDPAFAGRWNAGSNARNGGTPMDPQAYAQQVAYHMREAWGV